MERIAERRHAKHAILRAFRIGRLLGPFSAEWAGPPFFPRAHAPIPQVDERGETGPPRRKPELVAVRLDVRAFVRLDERLDASARLPGRLRQPAGEEHVVFGFEAFDFRLEPHHVLFDGGLFGHGAYRGIRNQTSGSHNSRAYGTGRSSISTSV